ncbi:MAG: hypothetical protein GY772_22210 [bacterium]|nr:hypothetical protein [bacterium]
MRQWFNVHPGLRGIEVSDVSVSPGAATGAWKAIITLRTPQGAIDTHTFFWAVWVPSTIDVTGWRWVTVRTFMYQDQGGKR